MSHSLLTCPPATHAKMFAVAIIAAAIVVAVGTGARTGTRGEGDLRLEARGPVIEAGKPVEYARNGAAEFR